MKAIALALAVALSLGSLATACSDDSTTSNEQSDAVNEATPDVVSTVHYGATGFDPASLTLRVGQAIALVNDDAAEHRFRTTPSALDSGAQRPGQQVTLNFTHTGDYQLKVDGGDHYLSVTVQPR